MSPSRQRYWALVASASLMAGALLLGYAVGRYLPDQVTNWMRR